MDCSTPDLFVHYQLPKFTQTHVHGVGDAIQPSHPLLSPSPPTFNLSQYQGVSNESVLHMRWPEYWSFSFCISSSREQPGLISFRMDWLDLLNLAQFVNQFYQLLRLSWYLRWYRVSLQFRRPGFNPWIRKISWRREWQPVPVFLPGESHGQRSLVSCSSWGCKESDMVEQLTLSHFQHFLCWIF